MVYTGIVQRVGVARYSWRTHQLEVRAPGFFERTAVGDSISVNGVCLTAVTFTDDVAYFGVMQETRNRTNLAPSSTRSPKDADQDEEDGEGSNKEKEIKASASADDEEQEEEWREVNLELSLLLGQQVGGHFVSGHVDTVAPLGDVVPNPDGSRDLWIDLSRRRIRDVPPSSTSSPSSPSSSSSSTSSSSTSSTSTSSTSSSSRLPVIHKGSICIDGVSLTVAEWRADEERFKVCLIPHTQAGTTLGKKRVGDEVNIEFDRSLKRLEGADAEWAWTAESAEDAAQRVRRQDEEYMRQAIALGEKGRYTAPPNPWVASLIVKDGRILGRGFHAKAGTAHAEVKAIQNALDNGATAADLKGSTFYVTLEPCHHTGRTPPCDRKLLEVGAARVVIAFVDPDDRVNGQGIKLLRESGVEVVVGVCEAEAKQSLLPFVHQRSSGKPYVVIKAAMSLDGRIACEDGTSQWITGENARQDGHRLRAGSQAIIVGSNTALKDRPRLNVRGVAGAETVTPLRVALDSTGKIVDGPLLDVSLGATLIFTSDRVKADVAQLWRDRGVEVVRVGEKVVGQGLDLGEVLAALAQRGILQVLIEGGGKLQSRFLAEDRADKVVLYYGARFLGSGGLPWAQEKGFNADTIATVRAWQLERVQQFGNDVCLEYVKP